MNQIKHYTTFKNHYEWQDALRKDILHTDTSICTIEVPRRYGKTRFCFDLCNAYLEQDIAGSDILYFSIDYLGAARMATNLILSNHMDHIKDRKMHVLTDRFNHCIVIPASEQELKNALESGMQFDHILIDDASQTEDELLYDTLMKADIDDSDLILIGDPSKIRYEKSVWTCFCNNPEFGSYRVQEASMIKQENPIEYIYDRFLAFKRRKKLPKKLTEEPQHTIISWRM